MNETTVFSQFPLSDDELKQIRDILDYSQCPNESLIATFPHRYKDVSCSRQMTLLYFDATEVDGHGFVYHI